MLIGASSTFTRGSAAAAMEPAGVRASGAATRGEARAGSARQLTPEQEKQLNDLKQRDRAVRAHEAAHAAVGGALAGAPSFSYVTGPDGQRYAVGGEVKIDTSRTGSPEEDIQRARQIRRAALAPADPSPQDRAVAASATRMEMEAQAELARRRQEANRRASDGALAAYAPPSAPGSLLDVRA